MSAAAAAAAAAADTDTDTDTPAYARRRLWCMDPHEALARLLDAAVGSGALLGVQLGISPHHTDQDNDHHNDDDHHDEEMAAARAAQSASLVASLCPLLQLEDHQAAQAVLAEIQHHRLSLPGSDTAVPTSEYPRANEADVARVAWFKRALAAIVEIRDAATNARADVAEAVKRVTALDPRALADNQQQRGGDKDAATEASSDNAFAAASDGSIVGGNGGRPCRGGARKRRRDTCASAHHRAASASRPPSPGDAAMPRRTNSASIMSPSAHERDAQPRRKYSAKQVESMFASTQTLATAIRRHYGEARVRQYLQSEGMIGQERHKLSRRAESLLLEHYRTSGPYPTRAEREALEQSTGLSRKQVAYWFGNRRMREKRQRARK